MTNTNSRRTNPHRFITDSIHGDIRLNPIEQRIVDTGSFQRLRQLKQLGMGHLTYPGATHTRFAHSIGVLSMMTPILPAATRKQLTASHEKSTTYAIKTDAISVPDWLHMELRQILREKLKRMPGAEVIDADIAFRKARQKSDIDLTDCNDESCLARLADAIGADVVVDAKVSSFDGLLFLNLKALDAARAEMSVRFFEKRSQSVEQFSAALPDTIERALQGRRPESDLLGKTWLEL